MKNIITIALILFLAFGFIFFYKKSKDLEKQNQDITESLESLQNNYLVEVLHYDY